MTDQRPIIGLSLGLVNHSLWVPLSELADEAGFESVWLPEHLVLPVTASGSPVHGDDHPPVPPHLLQHLPTRSFSPMVWTLTG